MPSAESKRSQRFSGNGTTAARSGTDGLYTTEDGCTGAHLKVVSPPLDGLGIRAIGIIVVSSINLSMANGIDSKTEDG